MESWNLAHPRATSNGDYGRFLFAPGSSAAVKFGGGHFPQFSTNGNRMVQHVHYPNCPNHNSTGNSSQQQGQGNANKAQGMPEYTIEYGEDAVKAALGGSYPEFQAQFQKQYGNGAGDGYSLSPQQMQMANGKNAKIAMVPVVLTTEVDGNEQQAQPQQQLQSSEAPSQAEAEAGKDQGQTEKPKPPKSETLRKTFHEIRKSRSNGQVKYGRHVRPSYWNPQVPNPCRKQVMSGTSSAGANGNNPFQPSEQQDYPSAHQPNCANYQDQSSHQTQNYSAADMPEGYPIASSLSSQGFMMERHPQQTSQMPTTSSKQKHRSFPPPKEPSNSLCGKCRKCKNLSSGVPPSSSGVITFPDKLSAGIRMATHQSLQQQKFNTSSNLGQSAKNFRAIRFSSNQHHRSVSNF